MRKSDVFLGFVLIALLVYCIALTFLQSIDWHHRTHYKPSRKVVSHADTAKIPKRVEPETFVYNIPARLLETRDLRNFTDLQVSANLHHLWHREYVVQSQFPFDTLFQHGGFVKTTDCPFLASLDRFCASDLALFTLDGEVCTMLVGAKPGMELRGLKDASLWRASEGVQITDIREVLLVD